LRRFFWDHCEGKLYRIVYFNLVCLVGISEKRKQTKLVEVLVAIFSDAGSIPAASTMK
jgi:hypothetical protein